MKSVALSLAVVVALGLAVGIIFADRAPTPYPTPQKPASLDGTISKATDDKGAFEVTPKDEKNARKFTTNDKTAIIIDGKEAKVVDLKEGMTVKVTYCGFSTVIKAEATSPAKTGTG
ncbi:MAG: hypothetical protein HZA50_05930 [Planctomycetes bacterium]|nr:hypothetical protein [Planctomycetota bacterium]